MKVFTMSKIDLVIHTYWVDGKKRWNGKFRQVSPRVDKSLSLNSGRMDPSQWAGDRRLRQRQARSANHGILHRWQHHTHMGLDKHQILGINRGNSSTILDLKAWADLSNKRLQFRMFFQPRAKSLL